MSGGHWLRVGRFVFAFVAFFANLFLRFRALRCVGALHHSLRTFFFNSEKVQKFSKFAENFKNLKKHQKKKNAKNFKKQKKKLPKVKKHFNILSVLFKINEEIKKNGLAKV